MKAIGKKTAAAVLPFLMALTLILPVQTVAAAESTEQTKETFLFDENAGYAILSESKGAAVISPGWQTAVKLSASYSRKKIRSVQKRQYFRYCPCMIRQNWTTIR